MKNKEGQLTLPLWWQPLVNYVKITIKNKPTKPIAFLGSPSICKANFSSIYPIVLLSRHTRQMSGDLFTEDVINAS